MDHRTDRRGRFTACPYTYIQTHPYTPQLTKQNGY